MTCVFKKGQIPARKWIHHGSGLRNDVLPMYTKMRN